jgi:predicted dehydrogenase
MGRVHASTLSRLEEHVVIVGVADMDEGRATTCAEEVGAKAFDDHTAMLDELAPDVVVVSTPHLSHGSVSIECLERGAHVIVEKPMAIDAAEADAMLLAAQRAGRHLVVGLQYRFVPTVEAARSLIDAGRLGRLIRGTCVESTMRSAAYYRSAPWRGTWAGEGGGVLVNQAPHPLDLLCYLGGTPARVVAWTSTLAHAIECEDTVLGQVEFSDGGVVQLAFSTAEPTPLRIELVGERARLDLTMETLAITEWSPDLAQHIETDRTMYDPPTATTTHVQLAPYRGDAVAQLDLHRDVVAALLEDREPRLAAASVLPSLEVANAIVLSAERGGVTIEFPLDRADFSTLLTAKREARP